MPGPGSPGAQSRCLRPSSCSKLSPIPSLLQEEGDMPTIASIDKLFTQATESKAMPGIVAVAATDKGTIYEGAFGKRELGKDAPMTVDSVVWIASMTKAITATAAMQMVERGQLSLERPASEAVTSLSAAKAGCARCLASSPTRSCEPAREPGPS